VVAAPVVASTAAAAVTSFAAEAVEQATQQAAAAVKQIEAAVVAQQKHIEEAVAAQKKQIEEAVSAHKETLENVVKAGADLASHSVDKAVALSKDHVETVVNAGSKAYQGYEDVVSFHRDNVEALIASSGILARGVQDLSKAVAELAHQQFEQSVAASKALFGAKNLREVFALSTDLTQKGFDKLVAEGTKLSELSSKIAEDASAPISGRVTVAVSRLTKAA
jgi:phasin family protein